ncbi:hypothetical protein DFS34DRAFT_683600 [Phlyctochytrium arcticum]|nr:hypothetical protein DFS34DRAFT_683600 [Phlyctochytrium arcticum]
MTQSSLLLKEVRERLYQPAAKFTLTKKEFDEQWQVADNMWTRLNKKASAGTRRSVKVTTIYTCRMAAKRQPHSSGPREDDTGSIKRRVTSTHIPIDCPVRLRVVEDTQTAMVSVDLQPQYGTKHLHHTLEDVDRRKICAAAQEIINSEAFKPYQSKEIAGVLPVMVAKEFDPQYFATLGVDLLTAKTVWNAKRRDPEFKTNPESQIQDPDVVEAEQELQKAGYVTQRFLVPPTDEIGATEGLAFGRKEELKVLQECSYLVLMDSTHKTNRWDWRLFTCMVRNKTGSWVPAGQFFAQRENGEGVYSGLNALRNLVLAETGKKWIPNNVMIDQSHIENLGIRKAFPGMAAGEETPRIYYCKVHVMRTFMKHLTSHRATYAKMMHALNKRTRLGCRQLVDEAIAGAPAHMATYLKRNWTNTDHLECWSMGARQHSPVLLQITSTNALESYHKQLKDVGKPTATLCGAVKTIVNVNERYAKNAAQQDYTFRRKRLTHTAQYPALAKLPHPLQRLVVDQIMMVAVRIEKGKPVPQIDNLDCNCMFARQYMLPCVHLFHQDMCAEETIFTDAAWERFIGDFEESGFELYWGRGTAPVREIVVTPAQVKKNHRKTRVKAAVEQLQSFHFKLEDHLEANPIFEAMMERFLAQLEGYTSQTTTQVWKWH